MPSFIPARSLLNPQFEGYKLSFTPEVTRVALPQHVNQSRTGVGALGFQQVASRVRHNHLAVGDGKAMYIADNGNTFIVEIDEQNTASLHPIFQIPQSTAKYKGEYPAAVNLSRHVWLLSDGFGSSYIIHVEETARLIAQWDLLMDGSSTPVPFQVHCAAAIDSGHAVVVISSSGPRNQDAASLNVKEQYIFDIWGVKIPLPNMAIPVVSNPGPRPFEIVWRRQGTYIPLHVNYVPEQSAFLLLGGSGYEHSFRPVFEPSPDEIVPIPRRGDGDTKAPPPYSWTQAGDSVTIAFGLPGLTNKNNVHASFERNKLSLRIGSQPSYVSAPLWDIIDPSLSLWTWERGTETKAGLLTLYLEKGHPGTRWSSVFRQGFETVEVPETLDPSELANIRDILDKYTAQEGSGLGDGVPSLAEGERDPEVDSSVGHTVQLTWVGGNLPSDDTPAAVLSLPLPGIPQHVSLITKSDIDGPLFNLDASVSPPIWKHTATYPALAFVLASKRDTRFTYHLNSQAVLAFESGARSDGSGNVYVYRGCNRGEKWAKQSVFQQGPNSGALIGAGAVVGKNGQPVMLCLSERELTVCQNVF